MSKQMTTCEVCDGSGQQDPMLPASDPANGPCEICKGEGVVSQSTEERAMAEGWDKSGIGYGDGIATITEIDAYVITANDSVEAVVLGSEADADAAKERLAGEYFERWRQSNWGKTMKEFREIVYWKARPTPIVETKQNG